MCSDWPFTIILFTEQGHKVLPQATTDGFKNITELQTVEGIKCDKDQIK